MEKMNFYPVLSNFSHDDPTSLREILICVSSSNNKQYLPTGLFVETGHWDDSNRVVKAEYDERNFNIAVYGKILQLQRVELDFWRRGIKVCPQLFSLDTEGEKAGIPDFGDCRLFELLDCQIAHSTFRESTRRNRQTTVKILKSWFPDIMYHEMDSEKMKEIESGLRNMGLAHNTVAKHMNHIRICLNWAMKFPQNRFRFNGSGFRLKNVPSKISFLCESDFRKIVDFSDGTNGGNKNETERKCVNAFLFCCCTGLRYSDLCNLKQSDIDFHSDEKWMEYHSPKTDKIIKVPLSLLFNGKALEIISYYDNNILELNNLPSNALVDKYLLKARSKLGISQRFSFHSARHTYATMLLNLGVKITTVQKLLGHHDVRTTMKYCEVLDNTVIRELRSLKQ